MIRENIINALRESLGLLGIEGEDIELEHPADSSHGDFSSNIALILGKKLKKNPKDIAKEIIGNIKKIPDVERINAARQGFINFYLSESFFADTIKDILKQKEKFGENTLLKNKKVIIEYTDPNPFKEFHIGHLMSNTMGESISRLLEYSKAKVKRANWQGDTGLHVAKVLWGKMKNPAMNWGDAYVYGAQHYEKNKKEINEINKKIYEKNDSEINELYKNGKKESLAEFEKMYERLGTKFNFYFFESEGGSVGLETIRKHKDVFEESEGAIVFHAEKFDQSLHTRVFVTKDSLPTYEAKELGLAKMKYDKYPYDISFVVTGNEVKDYFRVVHKAMEHVFPELAEKTKHIPHGMLRLPRGKMSSRTGDVISAESLLNDVKSRVLKKMTSDMPHKEEIADEIAVGAVKYSILKQTIGNDIIFDFEKSLSFEGDSGPYLQYTYARILSLLEKGIKEGVREKVASVEEITNVDRLLYRFPEVVERATKEYEPHYVTNYLTELAGAFNSWYGQGKILDSTKHAEHKLALARAVSITLQNGLWLLGIKAPERM
ncbi:arginine--tRNA ligase [Candidatus Kaiserbacteria bacterium]|nr:arginine--tRNA ligase [Candidatus Kaiserbacteria bacterium]